MALKLCRGCERHVRESDAACPYCGSTETTPVPAPPRHLNRKAMAFAAVVLTTAAVETVSCVALYGASVDCEVEDCGYPRRCQGIPVSAVGQGPLVVHIPACSEPIYRRLVDACVRDPKASDCPSAAQARPDCARCIIGPRDLELPTMVSPGATLSLSPLIVNTGACAAAALGRPDCGASLTAYEARIAAHCVSCADPGSLSACRDDQKPTSSKSGPYWEREVECLALRDLRRAEWEPVCVGATPEETLDKVAHVLCFEQ